jgi:hypothetical protein
MKKIGTILSKSILCIMFVFVAASCTKEGPAGNDGAPGTNGSDGTNGVDGNVSCLQCHTLTIMDDIDAQYKTSGHAAGNYVGYAGGRNGCAMCHSDQGFVETQATGRDTTATGFAIPMPISCETCHDNHVTFDFEVDGYVVPLRGNEPVELLMYRVDGEVVTLDLGDNSNICANCHQPRRTGPVDDGTGNFYISSPYYGPHHGPQSTILEGIGGAELGAGYPTAGSGPHRTKASCITCHMGEYSSEEGGHSWHTSLESCVVCHTDATTFDVNGKQTEIAGLIEELKIGLIAQGVLDTEGHPVVGTYPLEHAQAFYNYAGIVDDRSDGVHNYEYIKTLLINSINAVQ